MAKAHSWNGVLLQGIVFYTMAITLATGMALTRDKRAQSPLMPSDTVEPWRPYYITHACEWSFISMSCPFGRVLSIARVTFGRQNLHYCPEDPRMPDDLDWSTRCAGSQRYPRRIVSSACNGKAKCTLPIHSHIFGDPCPNTLKYLEVYYACVDASRVPRRHRVI